jgi:Periplasmic binding protein/Cytochrome c
VKIIRAISQIAAGSALIAMCCICIGKPALAQAAGADAMAADAIAADAIVLGRALYHGTRPFAKAVLVGGAANNGGTSLSAAGCANCHGKRGEGANEAGTRVPGVRWQQLRAHTATQPAYGSSEAIIAAIEHARGRDAALAAPMPRYSLNASERAGLLAYLQVLGTDADAVNGISKDKILLGAVLPMQGNQRAVGLAIQRGLQTRIDAANKAGGVFGRQLALLVEDSSADGSPQGAVNAIRRLTEERGVFALVGSYLPEIAALDEATTGVAPVPIVATLGVPLRSTKLKHVTYLLPSIEQQLQQLWAQMAKRCDFTQGADVAYVPAPALAEVIRVSAESAGLGMSGNVDLREIRAASDVDLLLRDKSRPMRPMVALLGSNSFAALRNAALDNRNSSNDGCLGSLAIFSGAGDVVREKQAARLRELVTLPMPPVAVNPADGTSRTDLWEMLAGISMRTFIEALARTGRELDHDRLERALMSLKRFEPVSGIRLEFSPQQRHGLAVSSIWKGDSHEHAQ